MITEDKILVQQAKIRKKKKRPAKNHQKLNFHLSRERFLGLFPIVLAIAVPPFYLLAPEFF